MTIRPGEGGRQVKKPELLAPAGDMESLRTALLFGADAVYIGGSQYSMRAACRNFDAQEIRQAVREAHASHARLYVACNILPRNGELDDVAAFLSDCADAGADAFILSDPGVIAMARRIAPQVERHVSTQTGIVNYAAANAMFELGASRVVLARELSLEEIAGIRRRTPEKLELEAFAHGSMCISFSGRCLLSNYLTGRDANHGACAQPCRWRYALTEERRPGLYFPIEQDARGTYILNARDMCMIAHVPEMVAAGVGSLKIEGRAKSAFYVGVVTNAYRMAIDACTAVPPRSFDPRLLEEVSKASHRRFCTGFYFGPVQNGQDGSHSYIRTYDMLASVGERRGKLALCRVRNPFPVGEEAEWLHPGSLGEAVHIRAIYDMDGMCLPAAAHPDMRVLVRAEPPIGPGLLRQPSAASAVKGE